MRNPEQTIGNLIDKQGVAFISSMNLRFFYRVETMHMLCINCRFDVVRL
jgi:hypothetical protein